MKVENDEKSYEEISSKHQKLLAIEPANDKKYSVDEIRIKYKEAYRPWTIELDDELTVMYCEGINGRDIAKHFGRTRGAIRSRIKKLELEVKYG
jgi:DNA-directed RNA polymerase specialized sigma24 family protein